MAVMHSILHAPRFTLHFLYQRGRQPPDGTRGVRSCEPLRRLRRGLLDQGACSPASGIHRRPLSQLRCRLRLQRHRKVQRLRRGARPRHRPVGDSEVRRGTWLSHDCRRHLAVVLSPRVQWNGCHVHLQEADGEIVGEDRRAALPA